LTKVAGFFVRGLGGEKAGRFAEPASETLSENKRTREPASALLRFCGGRSRRRCARITRDYRRFRKPTANRSRSPGLRRPGRSLRRARLVVAVKSGSRSRRFGDRCAPLRVRVTEGLGPFYA
jgi:hypothetical protein